MPHRRSLPLSATGMLSFTAVLLLATPAGAISSPTTAKEACKKPDKTPPAPEPCNRCSDLPKLNRELAQQMFLRDKFQEFIDWRLPPIAKDPKDKDKSAGQMMRDWVTARFNEYLNSPEGGGGGFGQPEMGTDIETCKLVSYPKDDQGKNLKDKAGNDITCPVSKDDIKSMYCPAVADMILTHEGQHQTDCKNNKKSSQPVDLADWRNYAAYDVRGYQAGIANLRKSIAALAKSKQCGWKGSTKPTKKLPMPPVGSDQKKDIEVDVIPTPQEIDTLAKTLGGKK
jgi:hypothetical protein